MSLEYFCIIMSFPLKSIVKGCLADLAKTSRKSLNMSVWKVQFLKVILSINVLLIAY